MDAAEMRSKTPDELRTRLTDLKKEGFNLRFQAATSQLENTARIRVVKRETARVMTVLNQKAADAAGQNQKAPAVSSDAASTATQPAKTEA